MGTVSAQRIRNEGSEENPECGNEELLILLANAVGAL